MNNTLTNTRLSPKQVIVVYQNTNAVRTYIERRDIFSKDGSFAIGAAVPMSDEFFQNIAKAYVKNNSFEMGFGSFIPEHILHGSSTVGKTAVIWYRPAMQRAINFSVHNITKDAAQVNVPATLYVAINTSLYIFALKGNTRPTLSTKLFNAPFFNIYDDGRVCLGTARIGSRAKTYEKEVERFERGFYMAEQNGGNHNGRSKTPLDILWKDLIKKKNAFPADQLVPHKKYKTLSDLLENLVK